MSGSDEIAEEAHRLAIERAFDPKRFLAILDRGEYVKIDALAVPAVQRDLVLPALRAMVSARSGVVRVNAESALLEFGDPLGCAVLVDCLQSNEPETRRGALGRLINSGIGNRTRSLAIDADAILTALEPSVADVDLLTRERALMVMGYLATPRAFDRLAQLLEDSRADVRAEAAIALGRAGQDRGAIFAIEDLLARPDLPRRPKHYHLILALEHLCESGDQETQVCAAAVALRFVRRSLASGPESANHAWNCLKALRKAELPEEADYLREIICSEVQWWVRGEALQRLAELEGRSAVGRLLNALPDPDLRDAALKGLRSLAGASDPAVIETLGQEIARQGAQNISALVLTFLACGGQAKVLAADIEARLDAATAMAVHWLLSDIRPREVVAKLLPACGEKEISEAALEKLEEKWRTEFNAELFVWNILSEPPNCLAGIVCKTVTSPAEHEHLIEDLAAITSGRFAVEDVAQTVEPSGEELRLLLVHRGRGYSFSIEHRGRWLNLSGVLVGLNGILESLGVPERFIELGESGGECAVVTFVHAEKFLAAARELRIQLANPP